jgi:hypothetical protein
MKVVKKSKRYSENPARWSHDANKVVTYEFSFKGKTVTAGTTVMLKFDRTQYKFICLVHDTKLDSTWLELLGADGYRSVRIDRIGRALTTTKKSRAKKQ